MSFARFAASFAGVVAFVSVQAAQAPPLRVVVLEGEDAVNIVQQKTAVRPVVEVRDRNNLPVAGATVTFTIGTGQPAAFAGGVQTLTVTTNAAGQAAASGFNVLGNGAVQIQVQAAYQGQIATAAIAQTNVATAAAASQAGAAQAAGGGAAGGGGGGISVTTIAIIGGAVAGGAVAATQTGLIGGGGGTTYTGSFNGDVVTTTVTESPNGSSTCVSTRAINATIKITLHDGDANGELSTEGTTLDTSIVGPLCSPITPTSVPFSHDIALTGGPSTLTGSTQTSSTSTTPATVTATATFSFTGALSNNAISGTYTYTHATRGSNNVNGVMSTITGNGTASFPVTLR